MMLDKPLGVVTSSLITNIAPAEKSPGLGMVTYILDGAAIVAVMPNMCSLVDAVWWLLVTSV